MAAPLEGQIIALLEMRAGDGVSQAESCWLWIINPACSVT